MELRYHPEAGKILRLVLFHPEKTVNARRHIARLAGNGMNTLGAELGGKFRNLDLGPLVEPQSSGANDHAILGQGDKCLALV